MSIDLQTDIEKLSNDQLLLNLHVYKNFKTSRIDDLIVELEKRNLEIDKVSILKEELLWRESVRNEVLAIEIHKKISWGLIPTLKHKTKWKIPKDSLWFLGNYIRNIMFWNFEVGWSWNMKKYHMSRSDAIDGKSHAKIQMGSDKLGYLKVKCIATGDLIFDNERNITSLKQFLKAFELIAKRENIII